MKTTTVIIIFVLSLVFASTSTLAQTVNTKDVIVSVQKKKTKTQVLCSRNSFLCNVAYLTNKAKGLNNPEGKTILNTKPMAG